MRWRKIAQDRWAFWGWAVLGLGVLLLAVGIPLSIWAVQRSGGPGPVPPGSAETTAPGLPSEDSATVSDTVEVEVQRGQGAPAAGGTGPEASGLPATDSASVTDTAELEVQRAPVSAPDEPARAEPGGGGRGDSATVQDSVAFVVRDAAGNIKEQGVAE